MTTDPKLNSMKQARDLLLPGLYKHHRDGDLWISPVDDSLLLAKPGEPPKTILSHAELASPDCLSIAMTRMGRPA